MRVSVPQDWEGNDVLSLEWTEGRKEEEKTEWREDGEWREGATTRGTF